LARYWRAIDRNIPSQVASPQSLSPFFPALTRVPRFNVCSQIIGRRSGCLQKSTAQRLQGEVGSRRGQATVTTEGNMTVVENEPATVETIGGRPEGVPKKSHKTKIETVETGEKKLSCVNAALQILSTSAEPMNAQELITAMTDKGLWASPGGKTPHATLYSAILRDMAKGDDSRFIKSERGRFSARA